MQAFSKRSPLYIFGAPARSETPPQNNYVALQRETPSLTTNMGIWQHGNSLEEFLKIEGMPILGFMLSIVKPTWMLASLSHAFLILSQTRSFYCTVKYVLLQYCSPIVCLSTTFRGLFFFLKLGHLTQLIRWWLGLESEAEAVLEKAGQTETTVYTSRPSINQSVVPSSSRPLPYIRLPPVKFNWKMISSVSSACKTVKGLSFPESAGVEGRRRGWGKGS